MKHLPLVLFVLMVLVAAAFGGSSRLKEIRLNRVKATGVSCVASMRVLEGAIELYFDDHKEVEKTAEAVNDLINTHMHELIQGKYLRESLQDQVQGCFHELPIPQNALPACHISAVASGTDYILECSLHGNQDSPRPLDDLLKLVKLDSDGNYDAAK
ncbi:MAG: hypothetical protein ACD_39C00986G0001 [uncultured bacterium]|nr:MAG: hypothetical protein ACD_39C00986G0001 [uncultured bacterium]